MNIREFVARLALTKRASMINVQAAHIWSFGVLLWEMETRMVPFEELSPMETGFKVLLLLFFLLMLMHFLHAIASKLRLQYTTVSREKILSPCSM